MIIKFGGLVEDGIVTNKTTTTYSYVVVGIKPCLFCIQKLCVRLVGLCTL
ncbi:hypothetical protein QJS04_geneDACA000272 [Acorus gramineus]|uniref:Uncharacterized protein n=1 Tax=Acorus gramineus TaxID=55184 RepID=A0AAV9AST7_ACOGR|nr:hypothetical protein QJS04_geneDACA000272 [Acorus gramineus]